MTRITIPLFVSNDTMRDSSSGSSSQSRTGTVRMPTYCVESSDCAALLEALLNERASEAERNESYAMVENCFLSFVVGAYLGLVHLLAILYIVGR